MWSGTERGRGRERRGTEEALRGRAEVDVRGKQRQVIRTEGNGWKYEAEERLEDGNGGMGGGTVDED